MKTKKLSLKLVILAGLLITFASCEKWDVIGMKGEGEVVTNDLETTEIEGIILSIPATVYLEQGEEQSISIEAQQNIYNNIIKEVKNGSLKLKFDKNVAKCEPIVVRMTITNLKEASISGSGEISSTSQFNNTDENLDINISGSGDINLDANAKDVDINISGTGGIKLKTDCNSINGNISGSGDITLDGTTGEARYNISGSGDIFAYRLLSETCNVHTAGSGNAQVYVSNSLSVDIAGSGNVYYIGTPAVSMKVAGSGSVVNKN